MSSESWQDRIAQVEKDMLWPVLEARRERFDLVLRFGRAYGRHPQMGGETAAERSCATVIAGELDLTYDQALRLVLSSAVRYGKGGHPVALNFADENPDSDLADGAV